MGECNEMEQTNILTCDSKLKILYQHRFNQLYISYTSALNCILPGTNNRISHPMEAVKLQRTTNLFCYKIVCFKILSQRDFVVKLFCLTKYKCLWKYDFRSY